MLLNTGVPGGAHRLQWFKSRLDQLVLDETEHCISEKRMPESSADHQFMKRYCALIEKVKILFSPSGQKETCKRNDISQIAVMPRGRGQGCTHENIFQDRGLSVWEKTC